MFKIGLIINPVAGLGGPLGLKGTDGAEILKVALAKGALPRAPSRAASVLKALKHDHNRCQIITCPGPMGSDTVKGCGLSYETLPLKTGAKTTPGDTFRAAKLLHERFVDLLLFVGGDGTARDIYSAVGEEQLCLGVPAGVKMHSPVFALSPHHAGEIVLELIRGRRPRPRLAEVMDIDEEAFRLDQLRARLFGYLKVPGVQRGLQVLKAGSTVAEAFSQQAIAAYFSEEMDPSKLYLIGPGTTTRAILEALGQEGTLLGVDAISRGRVVGKDLSEKGCLELLDEAGADRAMIVVTPIGGQGFILGRGNQQLSAGVVRQVTKKQILVVATAEKLQSLRGDPFRLDTGSPDLDRDLCGIYRVLTGYRETSFYRAGI